jgi:hypothetical protein
MIYLLEEEPKEFQMESINVRIRIKDQCDPHPNLHEPQFIKDSWAGLVVTATAFLQPGERDQFPRGAYLVEYAEILRALSTHNPRAYRYYSAAAGKIAEKLKESETTVLMISFPCDCCDQYNPS